MFPTAPKFGGWWQSVRRAGRKEVRHGWTGFVTRTKKTTKTKKIDPLPVFCFLPFFCKNGLGLDRPRRLRVRHRGLPFGPQIEAESLFLLNMGSDRSILTQHSQKSCWQKQLFFGYYNGYYGITGVIPCQGKHLKARSQIVLEYNILHSILAKTMLWSKNTPKVYKSIL